MALFCSFYPCSKEFPVVCYRLLIENSISQSGGGQNASPTLQCGAEKPTGTPSRTVGRQRKQGAGRVLSQIVEFFLPLL